MLAVPANGGEGGIYFLGNTFQCEYYCLGTPETVGDTNTSCAGMWVHRFTLAGMAREECDDGYRRGVRGAAEFPALRGGSGRGGRDGESVGGVGARKSTAATSPLRWN